MSSDKVFLPESQTAKANWERDNLLKKGNKTENWELKEGGKGWFDDQELIKGLGTALKRY